MTAAPAPAGATLEIAFERVGGARRARRVLGNGVLLLVGLVTQAADPGWALTELVVRRRGVEIIRGDAPGDWRPRLDDEVARDLRTLTERAFLDRWGEPGRWRDVLAGR